MDNLLENNKLIAEFMGFKYSVEEPDYKIRIPHFNIDSNGNWIPNKMVSRRDYSEWADTYQDEKGNGYEISFDMLEFNSSYDWLMPVVEKIETKFCSSNIHYYSAGLMKQQYMVEFLGYGAEFSIITHNKNKLKAIYEAVIEFIKWYNKNNKK